MKSSVYKDRSRELASPLTRVTRVSVSFVLRLAFRIHSAVTGLENDPLG